MDSGSNKTKLLNKIHRQVIDGIEADTNNPLSKITAQMMRDGLNGNKEIAGIMDRMLESVLTKRKHTLRKHI